jgi:uncharacterized iron-regulated membrane protein
MRPLVTYGRMALSDQPNIWQRWIQQPQSIWLRRALFQVHLWSGIGLGLYVLMISVTGSVLVYRNELYEAAAAKPIFSTSTKPPLTEEQLKEAVLRAYPDYVVDNIARTLDPNQSVDVWVRRGNHFRERMFDPRTGDDLGDSIPLPMRVVATMLDLHDNLLAGPTGRKVNGLGALAVLALVASGMVIWWPGAKTWRRSLRVHRGVGWKRMMWELHSMIGFWSLGFILLFLVSGLYLSIPDPFQNLADRLGPVSGAGDRVVYWLSILHFGRICGIGFLCSGPGFCDQGTKITWALFGLAPAVMFVTGAIMWWNRVLRPRWQALSQPARSDAAATTLPS